MLSGHIDLKLYTYTNEFSDVVGAKNNSFQEIWHDSPPWLSHKRYKVSPSLYDLIIPSDFCPNPSLITGFPGGTRKKEMLIIIRYTMNIRR